MAQTPEMSTAYIVDITIAREMTQPIRNDAIVDRVETFVQRIHDLDYIVKPEASKTPYATPNDKKDTPISLADYLANSIYEYEKAKQDPETDEARACARICLLWINRAFADGMIQEGQGLVRRVNEAEQKIERLQDEVRNLQDENLLLRKNLDQMKDAIAA